MSDAVAETFPSNIVSTVVESIDGDSVTVSSGGSRFRIPRAELGNVAQGAAVELYIDQEGGKPYVSKRMADALKLWDDLARAAKEATEVDGEIVAVIKGGLSVDVGMRAFLPASQVALRPVENLQSFVGQRLRFRVIELDARRGRLVVSRRALLEAERAVQRDAQLKSLSVGDKVSGVIVSLVGYGAFVDIGGVDALLRLEDMSWGHVRHGSQVFAEGDTVQAKVLEIQPDKGRVAIGVKQLTPDPWQAAPSKYAVGSRVRGKVLRLAEFGAFVELEPNVEALLHVSEMKWGKSVRKPSEVVQKGQEVEAIVLDVDADERRMALGMRQLTPNPWKTLRDSYARGSKVSGTVKSVTEFGAFLELPTGVDGLLHASDMSWTERVKPSDRYNVGDVVEVVLLDINVENERISLGVKQLSEDPWVVATRELQPGTKVTGKVAGVTDFGAFVELASNVQGLCHVSELTEDRDQRPADVVKIGDDLTVVVLDVDADTRRISLSALAVDREVVQEQPKAVFTNTLADKLAGLKTQK